jgi:predicted lysophospholipase L1 biosynthesis ABC-type transport system permease subunit
VNGFSPGPNRQGRRLALSDAEVGDQVRTGETTTPASSRHNTFISQQPDDQLRISMSRRMSSAWRCGGSRLFAAAVGLDYEQIRNRINREWPTRAGYGRYGPRWNIETAAGVLETNKDIADVISRFVLVLSLVGLVIGGVGIINTMVVAVNRRVEEIAILKTVGCRDAMCRWCLFARRFYPGSSAACLGSRLVSC